MTPTPFICVGCGLPQDKFDQDGYTIRGEYWHNRCLPRVVDRKGTTALNLVAKPKPPTPTRGPLPVMVPCSPYRAKLTVVACAMRWGIANGPDGYQHPTERARFAMKDRHTLCKGCSVGKERSESNPTAPAFKPPFQPAFKVTND